MMHKAVSTKQAPPSDARWVKCKGCGAPVILMPSGWPPHVPPKSVGHTKPVERYGVPSSTGCTLYNKLNPATFIRVHADAEQIPAPDELTVT